MSFRILFLALIVFTLASGAYAANASVQPVVPPGPEDPQAKLKKEMLAKEKAAKLEAAMQEAAKQSKHSSHPGQSVKCPGLHLEAADGLPNGDKHNYRFGGTCKVSLQQGMAIKPLADFPVIVKASWDAKKHQLTERVQIVGTFKYQGEYFSGDATSIMGCQADPIVIPFSACQGVSHDNDTGFDALSSAYFAKTPLAKGATTLAAATAMSSNAKPDDGTPPKQATIPPPKKPELAAMNLEMATIVIIRSPKPNEVVSGARLHLDVMGPEKLIAQHGLDGVDLEWQWMPATDQPSGRAATWQPKAMLAHLKWSKREGQIFSVVADLPMSNFSDSTRWRVRASALPAVRATQWVNFAVVPLGQAARQR